MRDKVDRQPVAASAGELAEAQQWTTNTVLALDEELREVRERFEIRGRLLIRCRRIVNTFQNAELAMKSLKLLLDGVDISGE